jgi:WD40 repeat protein
MLRRAVNESALNPRPAATWRAALLALAGFPVVAGLAFLHPADAAVLPALGVILRTEPARQPGEKPPTPDQGGPGRQKGSGKDGHGDPLPPGAIARLGTVRFRAGATSIAYSADGKLLAAGGADNRIRLIDAATGKELRRLAGHQTRTFSPPRDKKSAFDVLVGSVGKGNVTTVAFSPDGKTLASGGWDDMVLLWDVATGKELRKLDAHRALVARVVFSPDGKVLASRGGLDGVLRLWDPATGAELHKVEGLSRVNPWRFYREAALAFSPDSKTVAATSRKAILFHEVATGKEVRKLEGYRDCMYLAYSHDGKLLASGGLDDVKKEQYSLRLWDTGMWKELRRCELPKNEPPTCFAFSPDGSRLAACVAETDTFIFDVRTGKVVHRLPHYWTYRLAYAPDGKNVVTIRGSTIRNWDPATGKERFLDLVGHQGPVSAVALSPDGKVLASGGENIRLWDPATGKQIRQIGSACTALAFSPDGKQLASVSGRSKSVQVWDAASGKELFKLDGPRLLRAVVFSPDGKHLASGDEQATVRIWDLQTRRQLHEMDLMYGADTLSLAFSPDSKILACGGGWNEGGVPKGFKIKLQNRVTIVGKEGFLVLLWDVATGKELRRLAGLQDNIKAVAFSPDGKTVAATSRDGRIALWETATGKERLFILAHPEHSDAPFACTPCLAFSPEGTKLASGSTDRTVRLWDAVTAKELGQFRANAACYSLCFGEGGRTLVTGSADTTVTLWDALNPVRQRQRPNVLLIR